MSEPVMLRAVSEETPEGVNKDAVAVLESLLRRARCGEISSIAVVYVGPELSGAIHDANTFADIERLLGLLTVEQHRISASVVSLMDFQDDPRPDLRA